MDFMGTIETIRKRETTIDKKKGTDYRLWISSLGKFSCGESMAGGAECDE